ncbi:hypothetical protein MMC26_002224 [Xylographa opegraphella]|nr:hypothetical protein [Xylographa opegraphella]
MTTVLTDAEAFLAPVLHRGNIVKIRGQSVLEQIASGNPTLLRNGGDPRDVIIRNALTLLLKIHHQLALSGVGTLQNEILHNSGNRRTVDALLDLVSLEGIYPDLLPGVGVPVQRRVKSVLRNGTVSRAAQAEGQSDQDYNLLLYIVNELDKLASSNGKGLYSAFIERTLVDLIAARGQLAHNPNVHQSGLSHVVALQALLDETPLSTLFPALTSLIHPATPSWFIPHISKSLSLLPLRPDGIVSTIAFIASTAQQNPDQSQPSSGLVLSMEVLNRASKLLSSIPSSMTAEKYFTLLRPQISALLEEDGTDMRRAAAYIASTGILGKRIYGAPGKPGWNIFLLPIIESVFPKVPQSEETSDNGIIMSKGIVNTSDNIQRALQRLAALTLMFPNPGLVKRIMTPLLLPLWSILCLSVNPGINKPMYTKVSQILSTYFKVSAGADGFIQLIDHLLWDGGDHYEFTSNSFGVEIRSRSYGTSQAKDGSFLIDRINARVSHFIELLKDGATAADVATVFLYVMQKWLLGISSEHSHSIIGPVANSTIDPMQQLIYAKITQEMLYHNKNDIVAQPDSIFAIIQQMLLHFIDDGRAREKTRGKSQLFSILSMSSILKSEGVHDTSTLDQQDPLEFVSISFSLLNALLSSMDSKLGISTISILNDIQKSISTIVQYEVLPQSLIILATSTSNFISTIVLLPTSSPSNAQTLSPHASALATQTTALHNLTSPLPPIRGEGLASLTSLIASSSPVLDIPSTTILLSSLLQDEEEFVYLAAIKALAELARKHPRTVLRMLIERYTDKEEDALLDVRLRFGEALQTIITSLGTALTGEAAALLGDSLIALASRRGRRPKTAEVRMKGKLVEENNTREAKMAWGGEVPQFDEEEVEDEETARIADVLSGWEDQDGAEDVRIRTSALSILSMAIEANIAGLGSPFLSGSIDLAIAILKLESRPEKAILRRAAALLLMSVTRALDLAEEQHQPLGIEFVEAGLGEVSEVLGYQRDMETDEIVKGHECEIIEGLARWRTKKLLSMNGEGDGGIRFGLEGRLKGLDVNLDRSDRLRPRIEEIE